jgi:hypothetical protein
MAGLQVSERDCYAPSIGEIDNDSASGWNFLVRLAERLEEMGVGG